MSTGRVVEIHARDSIRKGSRSFSFASLLFAERQRTGAQLLYSWCRHCDDQIDETINSSEQASRLNSLRENLSRAYGSLQEATMSSHASAITWVDTSVTDAFSRVARDYAIPRCYPEDLLEGMAMDVRGDTYETLEDLCVYCYRVAGTVGGMMSHIMGITDPSALRHALDLGIAMQMTNIARDIREDALRGRVYLPGDWLRDSGISREALLSWQADPHTLFAVARRLLENANQYYASGKAGLRFLPFKSSWAVASAAEIYALIGHEILRKGPKALEQRTITTTWQKIKCGMLGLFTAIRRSSL